MIGAYNSCSKSYASWRMRAQAGTGRDEPSAELAELTRTLERDLAARIEAEIETLLALEPARG